MDSQKSSFKMTNIHSLMPEVFGVFGRLSSVAADVSTLLLLQRLLTDRKQTVKIHETNSPIPSNEMNLSSLRAVALTGRGRLPLT